MVSARQGPVFARILVVPATRDGLGPFYQDVIAVCPLEPWGCGVRRLPLFGAADLHRRLWLYALAYTIRQIIFWPPDRAEADDLEVTHPLHTLRRLIDSPLPLFAAGLP